MSVATDIAQALVDWVRGLEPLLQDGVPRLDVKAPTLPGVVVELSSWTQSVSGDDERFPTRNIQNVSLVAYSYNVIVLVDNETGPTPDGDTQADVFLAGLTEAMLRSAQGDATLGGRVPIVSRQMTAEFELPFVRWQDGTEARQAIVEIHVANPIQTQESW